MTNSTTDTQSATYHRGKKNYGTGYEMMARIDELEAKLAKAVEALEMVSGIIHAGDDPDGSGFFDIKHKEIEQVFSAIAAAKETA